MNHTCDRIKAYRRIQNWENFFLDSAIYSVACSLGIEFDNGFTPIAAMTGDLFTYMYSDKLPCDSGLTNYAVMPEQVLRVFRALGFDCLYLSSAQIMADLPAALALIRRSVARGVPVLAWGVGGVVGRGGERMDPMGEGALIGGYDGDVLLIHLYAGAERLAPTSHGGRPGVDADGYTAIPVADALASTHGIFIPGEPIPTPTPQAVYRDTIMTIPRWLTLPPAGLYGAGAEQYSFGRAAFTRWAEVLLDNAAWQTREQCSEDAIWNRHCSAYCSICTSTGAFGGDSRVVDYLCRAADACPALPIIPALLPLYRRMTALTQQIWDLHGGFMPSAEQMQAHAFRASLAEVLNEMGACCDAILRVFAAQNV